MVGGRRDLTPGQHHRVDRIGEREARIRSRCRVRGQAGARQHGPPAAEAQDHPLRTRPRTCCVEHAPATPLGVGVVRHRRRGARRPPPAGDPRSSVSEYRSDLVLRLRLRTSGSGTVSSTKRRTSRASMPVRCATARSSRSFRKSASTSRACAGNAASYMRCARERFTIAPSRASSSTSCRARSRVTPSGRPICSSVAPRSYRLMTCACCWAFTATVATSGVEGRAITSTGDPSPEFVTVRAQLAPEAMRRRRASPPGAPG